VRPFRYNPSLDGLRAFAVAAVVAEHAGFGVAGFYGVTVFFVISGYLITALLLAERERTGGIDLRGFYRRRWARLMPALGAVVAVSTGWLLAAGVPVSRWAAGLLGATTYTTDLLEVTPAQSHISNTFEWSWSLAIEEQFYLLWPLLLLVVLAVRLRRLLLGCACLLIAAAAWADRAVMAAGTPTPQRVNFSFDTHMDAIALGALLAVLTAGAVPLLVRRLAAAAGLVGAAGLIAFVFARPVMQAWWGPDVNGYGMVTLLALALVAAAALAPLIGVGAFLRRAPFVHLGKLSYGLYLWNMLARNVFDHVVGGKPADAGLLGLVWLGCLVGLAEASYRFVEVPLRRRWAHRRTAEPAAPLPEPVAV
jgi:peptidoglycan/LPS O-acetylase OafA/YrhL